MVIDLKVGVSPLTGGRSLNVFCCLTPLGKTRSSRVSGEPVGACPPCQFWASLQRLSGPAPDQLKVAGASRVSRGSTDMRRPVCLFRERALPLTRNIDRSQRAQTRDVIGVSSCCRTVVS